MRTIWKYTLDALPEQKIDVPYVFKFRHVAPEGSMRTERINVWLEVYPQTKPKPTTFYIAGTGWPVPSEGLYVGTAVMPSGLVWHVFWGREVEVREVFEVR